MTKHMLVIRQILLIIFLAAFFIGCNGYEDQLLGPNSPGAPRNLRASAIGTQPTPMASFHWDAPLDSTGITGYRVWWREAPQGAIDSIDLDADARSRVITGVLIQRGYIFSVAARRGNLFSEKVSLLWGGLHPPLPATNLSVFIDVQSVAHLTWSPATDTGITGYHITWQGVEHQNAGIIEVAGNRTTADITGLDRTKSYDFELRSVRGSLASMPVVKRWDGIPANPPVPPAAPTELRATSLSSTAVGLIWRAPNDTGLITYRLRWSATNIDDSGSIEITNPQAVINNLTLSTPYRFTLVALRKGLASSPVMIEWAPALRFGTAQSIRIYENMSPNGSAFTLDPSLGGPRNVALNAQPRAHIQLAIYTGDGGGASFDIGPAAAFSEFPLASQYDQNVYISDSSYPAASLDAWLPTGSIAPRIPGNGNIRAFRFPVAQSSGQGQGFYVRTGASGDYHYARVLIVNAGGKLLQGNAPNQYIELEISYQSAANLPYAKRAGGARPANLASYPRR